MQSRAGIAAKSTGQHRGRTRTGPTNASLTGWCRFSDVSEHVGPDDKLMDAGQDGTSPMILVRPRSVRMTLIRPRTSFVAEMLKSVEAL